MNTPIKFENYKSILFAGIGGGFDIFGSIPLWTAIDRNAHDCILSSYNGKAKAFVSDGDIYPEKFLKGLNYHPIYTLPKGGVQQNIKHYEHIVKTHNIDAIVAVDGGVDSLMRGDEEGAGTILEDFAHLIALNQVKGPDKFLVCSGFGTELEEQVCHHHVLENIALLAKTGGFLGSCSLVKESTEFKEYKRICELAWKDGRKSHVQTKIISAVLGEFGDTNIYDGIEANVVGNVGVSNFISPLMSMYWFFKLEKVVDHNLFKHKLLNTNTHTDMMVVYRQNIDTVCDKRKRKSIPY